MAGTLLSVRTVGGVDHVLKTPLWIFIIRILTIVLAVVILGLSAWFISGAYLDVMGLNIAASILTLISVLYIILAEKVSSFRSGYHIVAVLSLEAFFLALWLAAFAATAAERSKYSFDTYDYWTFYKARRDLEPRAIILYETGAAVMSATAGIGAWTWVLFIVTFSWTLTMFIRGRKNNMFPLVVRFANENHQMESQPFNAQQPQVQQQARQQPQAEKPIEPQQLQTAYDPQQGYQGPYQQPSPSPSPSPYQPTVTSQAVSPDPYQQQQHQQQHQPQQAVYHSPQELQGGAGNYQAQPQPYYPQYPQQQQPTTQNQ
ncbi:Membrane-associating domain [Geosmithia morbida]|uniref:Membrane-associating domain n=1 Tax=Geosmithia morbida TaxID=1094350 RepID=A0A9P4YYJ8_9HYPO|nr:Membrane-associating domain [Geosmithia morbida]KAF4124872.1 Membrane-associating domain [Geosmithia morbida]